MGNIQEVKSKYMQPLSKDAAFFRDISSLMNLQISNANDLVHLEKEIDYISLILTFPRAIAQTKIPEEINEISKNNEANKQEIIQNLLLLVEENSHSSNKEESNTDYASKVQANPKGPITDPMAEPSTSAQKDSIISEIQKESIKNKEKNQTKIVKFLGWIFFVVLVLIVSALAKQCGRNMVNQYKHKEQTIPQSYQIDKNQSERSSTQVTNNPSNNSNLRVLTNEIPTGGNALTLSDGIAYYFDENYLKARKKLLKQSIDDNGKKYVLDYFARQNLTPNVSVNSTLNSDFIYIDGRKIEYVVYFGTVDVYEPLNKYKGKQDYTQVIFATFENGKFVQTQCIDFGFDKELALKEKCRNELYNKQRITVTKNRLIDFENKYLKKDRSTNLNIKTNKKNQRVEQDHISDNPYNYPTRKLQYVNKLKNLILNNWYIDSYMVGKIIRVSFSVSQEGEPYDISCQGNEKVCKSALDAVRLVGLFPFPPKDCNDCKEITILMTPKL